MDGHDEKKNDIINGAAAAGNAGADVQSGAAPSAQPQAQPDAVSAASVQPGAQPAAGSQSDAQPGGIFSTPDLTIDSENIPETTADINAISPDAAAPNRTVPPAAGLFRKRFNADAKTAAKTAAPRIAPAPTAPASEATSSDGAANGPIASTPAAIAEPEIVTGDIELPASQKKSKAPLVITLLAIIILACGGIAVFGALHGWFGVPASTISVNERFQNFANYFNNSPDGQYQASDNSGIPFFSVAIDLLGQSDAEQYFGALETKYNEFTASVNTENEDELAELTIALERTFPTTVVLAQTTLASAKVLAFVDDDELEEAWKYIESFQSQDEQDDLSPLSDVVSYLEYSFEAYQIYKKNNCIVSGSIDQICVLEIRDTALTEVEDELNAKLANTVRNLYAYTTQTSGYISLLNDVLEQAS